VNSTSTCLFKCLAKRAKIVDRSFGLSCFFPPRPEIRNGGIHSFSTTIYLRYLRVSVSFTSAAITSFHQTCYIFLTATNQHIDTYRGMYISVMQQKCLQWRIGTGARCDLPYERKPNMQGLQVAESYLRFQKVIYQSTSFKNLSN